MRRRVNLTRATEETEARGRQRWVTNITELPGGLSLARLGGLVNRVRAAREREALSQAAIPSTGASGGRPLIMSEAFSAIIIVENRYSRTACSA